MDERYFRHAPRGRAKNASLASLTSGERELLEAILDDNDPRRAELATANASEASPQGGLSEFARAILDNPKPWRAAPVAAGASEASPPSGLSEFARAILGKPAEPDIREFLAQVSTLHEGTWDSSQHPRTAKGQSDGGQWISKGGVSSAGSAATPSGPFRTADFQAGPIRARLASFSGAASPAWPTSGPAPSWLPKVNVRVGAGAGAASRTAFGVIAGALSNAAMASYWQRLPPQELMVYVWVFELEKRVEAGTLSREDAKDIFTAAVLGANAQSFAPTGDRLSLVHKSALDFLGKAEAVYFARKTKEQGWAVQRGGYQLSGGRVFPTKRNSGLDGYALRKEQEDFFTRGLAQGQDPGYLRGQARVAGEGRTGSPPDRLDDPELEAALQRAIKQSKRSGK